MSTKRTIIPLKEALAIVSELSIKAVIEGAYESEGRLVYLDLSYGNMTEYESPTTVKLYCLPNPWDYVTEEDRSNYSSPEELEEIGLESILTRAWFKRKAIKKDWENRVRDFYLLHTFIK